MAKKLHCFETATKYLQHPTTTDGGPSLSSQLPNVLSPSAPGQQLLVSRRGDRALPLRNGVRRSRRRVQQHGEACQLTRERAGARGAAGGEETQRPVDLHPDGVFTPCF